MNPYDNCFTADGFTLIRMMRELESLGEKYEFINIDYSPESDPKFEITVEADNDLWELIGNGDTLQEAIHKAYIGDL